MKGTYIDVRGPHPVLFIGLVSLTLVNSPRHITVFEALTLMAWPNMLNYKASYDEFIQRHTQV